LPWSCGIAQTAFKHSEDTRTSKEWIELLAQKFALLIPISVFAIDKKHRGAAGGTWRKYKMVRFRDVSADSKAIHERSNP
jgi:hypothetical protein